MKKYILLLSLTLLVGCEKRVEVINERIFQMCMIQVDKKPTKDITRDDIYNCKNIATTNNPVNTL